VRPNERKTARVGRLDDPTSVYYKIGVKVPDEAVRDSILYNIGVGGVEYPPSRHNLSLSTSLFLEYPRIFIARCGDVPVDVDGDGQDGYQDWNFFVEIELPRLLPVAIAKRGNAVDFYHEDELVRRIRCS
jgi:hypothetical protein